MWVDGCISSNKPIGKTRRSSLAFHKLGRPKHHHERRYPPSSAMQSLRFLGEGLKCHSFTFFGHIKSPHQSEINRDLLIIVVSEWAINAFYPSVTVSLSVLSYTSANGQSIHSFSYSCLKPWTIVDSWDTKWHTEYKSDGWICKSQNGWIDAAHCHISFRLYMRSTGRFRSITSRDSRYKNALMLSLQANRKNRTSLWWMLLTSLSHDASFALNINNSTPKEILRWAARTWTIMVERRGSSSIYPNTCY